MSFFIIIIQHWLYEQISKLTFLSCHIWRLCEALRNAHSYREKEKDSEGWRKTSGWSLSSNDVWMKTQVSSHSRETETESLTATSSYRRLDRSSHWLNISQSKCFLLYLNMHLVCMVWCVWISWSSGWCKPLQVRCWVCVVVSALCVSENCSGVKFHS